jgi:flagellar biosynthesis/type III secretory pathway protein FliH
MSGVYFLAPSLKTAIVAIHQLPRTPETLWVRVLGKGNVQKQAIAELKALPEDNPFRFNALELLYNLRTILEVRQDLDPEDRELIMELSPLYLQRLEDATRAGVQQGIQQGIEQGVQQGIQQGVQQGVQQGQRLMVESMLQVKFGTLDEELSQIIEPLIQLEPLERTQLIMLLNREQLLARFSQQR